MVGEGEGEGGEGGEGAERGSGVGGDAGVGCDVGLYDLFGWRGEGMEVTMKNSRMGYKHE